MTPLKIILVDDHEILMDGIASLLNGMKGLTVVAKCANVEDAIRELHKSAPDIVITDISMGEETGLQLIRKIAKDFPLVKVIVLTMHDTNEFIRTMMEAGASGYLLKNVRQPELLKAIENVMNEQEYIQQELVSKYTHEPQDDKISRQLLSAREIEIIRLIANEMSTAEISKRLFISQFTVETHRKNILRKTGSKSVIGLLNYARKHDLL
ncbi:MAG: response regulator transcription factor [Chitinophagaceae bacterium]|nr:MAG: response regulator transcription factor [Chitinophagaceae bacterium]